MQILWSLDPALFVDHGLCVYVDPGSVDPGSWFTCGPWILVYLRILDPPGLLVVHGSWFIRGSWFLVCSWILDPWFLDLGLLWFLDPDIFAAIQCSTSKMCCVHVQARVWGHARAGEALVRGLAFWGRKTLNPLNLIPMRPKHIEVAWGT